MRRDLGALDVSKAASQLDNLDISLEGVSKLRSVVSSFTVRDVN
jgi:hypothetical protein